MTTDRWITPIGTVSFPSLFKPNEFNGKEKYEVTLLVDPNEEGLKTLKAAVIAAAKEKWNKHPKDLKNWASPFKDGNEKFNSDPDKYGIYEDKTVLTFRSEYAPGIVGPDRQPLLDENDIYAGCEARVSANVYAWEYMGKHGVSFGLLNVQKTGEGERIGGGRVTAENEFDTVEGYEGVDTTSDELAEFDV